MSEVDHKELIKEKLGLSDAELIAEWVGQSSLYDTQGVAMSLVLQSRHSQRNEKLANSVRWATWLIFFATLVHVIMFVVSYVCPPNTGG